MKRSSDEASQPYRHVARIRGIVFENQRVECLLRACGNNARSHHCKRAAPPYISIQNVCGSELAASLCRRLHLSLERFSSRNDGEAPAQVTNPAQQVAALEERAV